MDLPFNRAARDLEPLDQLVQAEDLRRINSAFSRLSEKDQRILSMRYGMNGKRVHSVAQVAVTQRISPQHAETIIQGAKSRLLAALANETEESDRSRTSSSESSSNTCETPTTSPSPNSSRTEGSANPSVKNAARSRKTV